MDIHQRILDRLRDDRPLADLSTSDLRAFVERVDNSPAILAMRSDTVRAHEAAIDELFGRGEA